MSTGDPDQSEPIRAGVSGYDLASKKVSEAIASGYHERWEYNNGFRSRPAPRPRATSRSGYSNGEKFSIHFLPSDKVQEKDERWPRRGRLMQTACTPLGLPAKRL